MEVGPFWLPPIKGALEKKTEIGTDKVEEEPEISGWLGS